LSNRISFPAEGGSPFFVAELLAYSTEAASAAKAGRRTGASYGKIIKEESSSAGVRRIRAVVE